MQATHKAPHKQLDIPDLSGFSGPKIEGKCIAWIPGMRTDIADWYLILNHFGDLNRFVNAGGDVSKVIVHFLSYDGGRIEPLWGTNGFERWTRKLKDFGITKLISPDFSSWANYPIILQLYNYYRSALVTNDLYKAGFEVVPNVCWSSTETFDVSVGLWGKKDTVLVDANHISKDKFVQDKFINSFTQMIEMVSPKTVIFYCGSNSFFNRVSYLLGKKINLIGCPSRAFVLRYPLGVKNG